MGKHSQWRNIAKKLRRKRIRQIKASERDKKLVQEQQKPDYKQWLLEQERIEEEIEKEEAIQSALKEEQWRRIEETAQKQWRELQKKIALAREEKMIQNMKIKLEWEQEQQRLKEIQLAKEKELEEKRLQQEKREKELLDFLDQGGHTPEHLKTILETNPGKDVCPFFQKVSACRFFEACSRNHIRPGISKIILIPGFFSDISLQMKENEHGSDSSLEFEQEDIYQHYLEFFTDVILELEKCGSIRSFAVCCNHEVHLRGNVYVQYQTTREALKSYYTFNGRWYAGKQLSVEFCNITNWKSALCGLFFRKKCPKGNSCNFLHIFKNPKGLYMPYEKITRSERGHSHRDQSSSRKHNSHDNWDEQCSERKGWRWSESPERPLKDHRSTDNGNAPFDKRTKEKSRSRHRSSKRSHSRSRSRSKGRSSKYSKKKYTSYSP